MATGVLGGVSSWTNHLLDMLEHSQKKPVMGSMEMAAAADGASRWSAIDPTTTPTEEDDCVLPGLYIKKPPDKKRIAPPVKVRESVKRELYQALEQKLGTTGVSLFSPSTDGPLITAAYHAGIDMFCTEMIVGETPIMGGPPLTTVEHDIEQLHWGRTSRRFPDKEVPICIYGRRGEDGCIHMPCFAYKLPRNQGALQTWLSPSQQHHFDETGEIPPRGPCLLCIRYGLEENVLSYGTEMNPRRTSERKAFVVPPFEIKMDMPGGYRSEHCIKPDDSQVVTSPFPRVSGVELVVKMDETGTKCYVDQPNLVYNTPVEALN